MIYIHDYLYSRYSSTRERREIKSLAKISWYTVPIDTQTQTQTKISR